MNILFSLSGSIACFKSAQVISTLVQQGHAVKVAATASALEFMGKATFEGLTGNKVFTDIFSEGQMMDHIHLAKWAHLSVLCPASANSLGELAHGLTISPVGALFLASNIRERPWLVAPAMNQEMWKSPAVQNNVKALSEWGTIFVEPGSGHQACGDVGMGRLAEPDVILDQIFRELEKRRKTS